MLVANNNFRSMMGRDVYKYIPAALQFYLCYDHDPAVFDPYWHSRMMMEHF